MGSEGVEHASIKGHVRGTSSIENPSIGCIRWNGVCTNHKGLGKSRGAFGGYLLLGQTSFLIFFCTLIIPFARLQLVAFLPGVSFGIEASLLTPGALLRAFVLSTFLNPICLFSLVSKRVIGTQIKQSEANILKSEVSLSLKVVNDIVH